MNSRPSFEVAGKNVIVTGAAVGIGFAITEAFAAAGANVLLTDRDEVSLVAAMRRLGTPRGQVKMLVVDVADASAGERAVKACVDAFGSLDVLVNNAGIYPQVPLLQMSVEQFDRVIAVNLRGLVLMSRAAGLRFVEQKTGGSIINVGSVDSLHPSMVGLAAYDASKGGVLMFTRAFAREMAPQRVRVNAILPGGVDTEGTHHGAVIDAEMMKQFIAMKVPMGRMARPEEMAGAALYFASDASSYATGSHLVLDGGMLLT